MQIEPDGAEHLPAAVQDDDCVAIALTLSATGAPGSPGVRLRSGQLKAPLIASANAIAATFLGGKSRPVSAKFFDKTAHRNWALGWHQDRTIAVRARVAVPGFGAWTLKSGIHHCEPPFSLLASMLTLRIHIDAAGPDNSPLLIAPGSHRRRIAETDIPEAIARYSPAACLAAPGDVWVYSLPILHASARAVNPARRRVLQISYSTDDLPGGLEWLGV